MVTPYQSPWLTLPYLPRPPWGLPCPSFPADLIQSLSPIPPFPSLAWIAWTHRCLTAHPLDISSGRQTSQIHKSQSELLIFLPNLLLHQFFPSSCCSGHKLLGVIFDAFSSHTTPSLSSVPLGLPSRHSQSPLAPHGPHLCHPGLEPWSPHSYSSFGIVVLIPAASVPIITSSATTPPLEITHGFPSEGQAHGPYRSLQRPCELRLAAPSRCSSLS